jgi:phosphatidylserine decarboxylase
LCLVFRLGVNDYHRYIFIDNGEMVENYKIAGELHTVRSISEKYNVFSRNSREISILRTEHIGDVAQIEVGALLVGAIKNNEKEQFVKGEEKGYFEYGGSTIVLLFEEGRISLDEDIIEQSKLGIETKVSIGERIGFVC